ncbi:MAG: hypothetical protein ACLP50_28360 [Solirubrobacteraceae bacterium]
MSGSGSVAVCSYACRALSMSAIASINAPLVKRAIPRRCENQPKATIDPRRCLSSIAWVSSVAAPSGDPAATSA